MPRHRLSKCPLAPAIHFPSAHRPTEAGKPAGQSTFPRPHDEIEQNLLQLDGIARRQVELVSEIESDTDLAANQFAVEQGGRRPDKVIDVDQFLLALALLEKVTESVNDLAGPAVLIDNLLERIPNFCEVRRFLCQ